MQQYRMNRLFHEESGRCLDVAVDHGITGQPAMLKSIENMPAAIDTLVAAAPDAIQLTVGQARLLQARPGRAKPALVLRLDASNVYAPELAPDLYSLMIDDPVGQAVRLDAACVVVNLLDVPDRPELRRDCIENIMFAQAQCAASGMPLMVEPLAFSVGGSGGYDTVGDLDRILALVRQAVELGADIIKADPTEDPADYGQVVEIAAPIPVLVRGGGRVPDEELFARTQAVLDQGARGIVYGRNIIQHANPEAITRALMAMLHEGFTPEQAQSVVAEARDA